MFAFLLTLLILDALVLSAVVLLQAGQGGGLASLGGATTDTVLGGRQAVTILHRLSWWCGGIWSAPGATFDRMRTSAPSSSSSEMAHSNSFSSGCFSASTEPCAVSAGAPNS